MHFFLSSTPNFLAVGYFLYTCMCLSPLVVTLVVQESHLKIGFYLLVIDVSLYLHAQLVFVRLCVSSIEHSSSRTLGTWAKLAFGIEFTSLSLSSWLLVSHSVVAIITPTGSFNVFKCEESSVFWTCPTHSCPEAKTQFFELFNDSLNIFPVLLAPTMDICKFSNPEQKEIGLFKVN